MLIGTKKDEISVENDSPKETVQEEVADVKTVDAKLQKQKQKLQNRQSQRLQKKPKTTSEAEEIPLEEIPVEEIPAGDPIAGIIESMKKTYLHSGLRRTICSIIFYGKYPDIRRVFHGKCP